MPDKQKSQTFIHNLLLIHDSKDKIFKQIQYLAIAFMLCLFGRLFYLYLQQIVLKNAYLELAGVAVFFFGFFVIANQMHQLSKKLTCPKCDQMFFPTGSKMYPLMRGARCPKCGLEIRQIENTAQTKIPFAID